MKAFYVSQGQKRQSSSDSDQSSSKPPQIRKIENPLEKIQRDLDQDSLSQEDSSDISEVGLAQKWNGQKMHQKGDELEDDSDRSVDRIEERIQKLERQLEERIGKHKKDKPKRPAIKPKLTANVIPSLTKKVEAASKIIGYQSPSEKQADFKSSHLSQQSSKLRQDFDKLGSPKRNKQKKDIPVNWTPFDMTNQKPRIQSSRNARNDPTVGYQAQKCVKANKQIEDQQKALEELRSENKRLREKLAHSKKKKPGLVGQVDKLKNLTTKEGVKLQKQIELLKIIQNLHTKLKRSIHRKLTKSRSATYSSSLLHKGLPSSVLG